MTLVQPGRHLLGRRLTRPAGRVRDRTGGGGATDWKSVKTLRLVAEVLSPSTARQDRFAKRQLYQAQMIEALWLVDAEHRMVEVWTPESRFPVVEPEQVMWQPAGSGEPLAIPLTELFGAVSAD